MARRASKKRKAPKRLTIEETGIDGARLAAAREKAGMSQQDLAALIGYTYGNISKLERGLMGCRTNVMRRFAIALRVTADHLMGLS